MVLVLVSDRKILGDNIIDLLFQLLQIDIRREIREGDGKAVAQVGMTAALIVRVGQIHADDILGGVGHQTVVQGVVDLLLDLVRLRAKDIGTGYQHLLAHA